MLGRSTYDRAYDTDSSTMIDGSRLHVAVVGHVEWVTFARVAALPAPGEIVHASDVWDEAGGGGAVAAVHLGRRARGCLFLTALGEDDAGRHARERLTDLGVE